MFVTNNSMLIRCLCIIFVLFLFLNPLNAEEYDVETVSVDIERMNSYLAAEADKLAREARERINTKEKIEAERPQLLKEFRFMLGLDPLPERCPLNLTRVRTVERDEYTVEVLHYQSLPGFYVTANLYKPKDGKAPFPAVIWGPGHSPDPSGAKALRQNYAIPWVRGGYICLMIDPVQVAEIFGVHRGTHSWDLYDWYARGYTPAGIEVWNAMRGVNYLLTRPDVDGGRLTINGVSGGGHLSWMTGAADERISVIQPVAGTADVQAHIQLDLQRMHCDCAYFINIYRHDWPTLAALICPRPLLMHNSSGDRYYPPEGYKRVLGRAKEIYGFFGIPDKTDMFEIPGRHGYFQSQREKAVEWSDLWLLDKKSTVKERPFEEIPFEQLAAFGGNFPEDNINAEIQERLIPAAKLETYKSKAEWEKKRAEILENLKTVVFRNMPQPYKAVKTIKGDNGSFVLETEEGILAGMSSHLPRSSVKERPAILYIASPGDTENSVWNFLRTYPFTADSTARHIVFPRGTGIRMWDKIQERRFERCAMILGRTVDEMRLYDVLCAVDYASSHPSFDGSELTVVGKGEQGLLGVYAALLDERITRVILHSPPLSHKNGPTFLNILRYTDIPQVLAMLAPREIAFLTWEIEAFDYTKNIYGLYNAENKFRRAYTVTQVLNQQK